MPIPFTAQRRRTVNGYHPQFLKPVMADAEWLKRADALMGMHMAFDNESSEKLHDLLVDKSHDLVRPPDEDDVGEDAWMSKMDEVCHVQGRLMTLLSLRWISEDV